MCSCGTRRPVSEHRQVSITLSHSFTSGFYFLGWKFTSDNFLWEYHYTKQRIQNAGESNKIPMELQFEERCY